MILQWLSRLLTFNGGVVFGYAEYDSSREAITLLTIMVKCLFGGKKFIEKLILCHALTAEFQFQCVQNVMELLHNCGATVKAVINDNNRINQAFFKLFSPFNPLSP
ncbi:hypothetical protein ElyMa_000110600 [Elysia marginata]|uniref:Transposable element P transposase-like RNase H domain-containing protein n=1 Tax=Elysia marginata TaxID=1093978 RepID=A0AAV4ENC6_9GAST|nr:hypothetical protein ElyMa_000110600 [Elysia marginata]